MVRGLPPAGRPGRAFDAAGGHRSRWVWAAFALLGAGLFTACPPEGETVYSSVPPEPDDDGDGYLRSDDCNDEDADVYPGAEEDPSGDGSGDDLDNDCDGKVDEGTLAFDDDFDGYSELQGDCDDDNRAIFPTATDGCDDVDGDCDGLVDEDAADTLEPNDFRSTAVSVGYGAENDLTCDFAALNLNLLPTGYNDPGPDIDWFTFFVQDGEQPGCTYGVTATLKYIPVGQTVILRLYPTGSNTPAAQTSFTSTSSDDTAVLQWVGPRNGGESGVYYLEVTSPTPSTWCAGGMRLVIQGLAPPTEIPTTP